MQQKMAIEEAPFVVRAIPTRIVGTGATGICTITGRNAGWKPVKCFGLPPVWAILALVGQYNGA